jgi:hypothetical protein
MGSETLISMYLLSLPPLAILSVVTIVAVALTGCIAAIHSWLKIADEQKRIKLADSALTGDSAWDEAYPHDKLQLATWLRQNGIKPDSHLGDFIRTCWSAWLGGRPASLAKEKDAADSVSRNQTTFRIKSGMVVSAGDWIRDSVHGLGRILKLHSSPGMPDRHRVWFIGNSEEGTIIHNHRLLPDTLGVVDKSMVPADILKVAPEIEVVLPGSPQPEIKHTRRS